MDTVSLLFFSSGPTSSEALSHLLCHSGSPKISVDKSMPIGPLIPTRETFTSLLNFHSGILFF